MQEGTESLDSRGCVRAGHRIVVLLAEQSGSGLGDLHLSLAHPMNGLSEDSGNHLRTSGECQEPQSREGDDQGLQFCRVDRWMPLPPTLKRDRPDSVEIPDEVCRLT